MFSLVFYCTFYLSISFGYLGCSHLAIVNGTVNIPNTFLRGHISLGCIPRDGIVGSYGVKAMAPHLQVLA